MAFISYEMRKQTFAVIENLLTEDRTDTLAKALEKQVKAKLPRWLRWLPIRRVVDAMLPEALLGFIADLLEI